MKLGSIVIVRGRLDNRVRDKGNDAVVGTLEAFLADGQVSVILQNNDLWVGDRKEIYEYKEEAKEKNQEDSEKEEN